MSELSDDEWIVLILSALGTVALCVHSIGIFMVLPPPTTSRARRLPPLIAAIAGLTVTGFVLVHWSDAEIRAHEIYIVLFLLLGATWLEAVALIMPLAGLRLFSDAAERANLASACAGAGAIAGASLCFAGANIGGGATIWSTILPAILATATWFIAWSIVEAATGVSEAIAIDRDLASGWRLASFLISAGLVLGRAVAGTYQSAAQTLRDFAAQGWPLIPGILAMVVLQHWAKPTPREPIPSPRSRGILPAAIFLSLAAMYVLALGWWDGKR